MTDRELLELAWRANGDPSIKPGYPGFCRVIGYHEGLSCECMVQWNPLLDDGDALRMAVKFEFDIEHQEDSVFVNHVEIQNYQLLDWHNGDRLAATRRAIVRAAAEIGKQMEKS